MFAAFDDMLRRNRIRSKDLAAVAMAGGTAKIPLVAQRLSAHTKTSVITAVQPGLATAVGAVKLSARQPIAQQDGEREETTMAALVGASTGGFATSTSGLATTGRFMRPPARSVPPPARSARRPARSTSPPPERFSTTRRNG